jgi:hypothetical protein
VEPTRAHVEATRGGDPASTFGRVLPSLFDAKRAFAKDRESGKNPPQCLHLGWEEPHGAFGDSNDPFLSVFQPTHGARFVGWANAEFLYLYKVAAYAAMSGFSQRGNIPLWHRPKGALGGGVQEREEPRRHGTQRYYGEDRREDKGHNPDPARAGWRPRFSLPAVSSPNWGFAANSGASCHRCHQKSAVAL